MIRSVKTGLILGNGPSLNRLPLSLLTLPTWTCNLTPVLFPDHYVCIDPDLIKENAQEILDIARRSKNVYLSYRVAESDDECAKELTFLPTTHLLYPDKDIFKDEIFMSGNTATYVMLKLAYYAGFEDVWLWGVDHSVEWDHYISSYPGQRSKPERHLHRMKVMEKHYRLAESVYRAAGRRILNFSNPSALDSIFERGTEAVYADFVS